MTIRKPMLAGKVESIDALPFPMIASPKIDGIRCVKKGGKVLSRTLKPIPNEHIRKELERILPEGADGEIISGSTFQDCTSAVMSHKGEPDFTYWLFDLIQEEAHLNEPYKDRLRRMKAWGESNSDPRVKVVPVKVIRSKEDLLSYEEKVLKKGYEGVMLRTPESPYKQGRSTTKQGWLLKLKRFEDSEAVILGFVEQMHNANAATIDELGHTKRSTAKAGKVPAGTLGKFRVRDLTSGLEFKIGTGKGLTAELRQEIWNDQASFKGKIVKYKYQPIGVKVAPRLPIFIGFRDERDL